MRFIQLISLFLLITSCGTSISLTPESNGGGSNNSRDANNANPDLPQVTVNNYEKEIFLLVNDHRAKLGKNKLKWHDDAIVEAQGHSQDMASFRVPFGHTGFSDRIARIKAKDSDTIFKSGENVAQNSTAQKAFNAWLNSPGHRANIEGDYTHTGIGAAQAGNGSWYFTQIFLKK